MRFFIFLFLFLIKVFGIPRSNPYVEHPDVELHRMGNLDAHPHKPTRKYSSKMPGFQFNNEELTSKYWLDNAKALVEEKVKLEPNTKKARNVILFVGDGMSHYSVAAARMLIGGEDAKLSFEKFPYTASSMTYCVNVQVPDSACTATAFLSGIKTNNEEIGVNAKTTLGNCFDILDESNHVDSIATWFQNANRSTGVVTNTRITHATPAGAYAHTTHRSWEDDSGVISGGCDPEIVDDIAEQLVYGKTGKRLKVMFGGGSGNFINKTTIMHDSNGKRSDGKNLIDEWLSLNPSTRKFVKDRKELMDVKPEEVDQILGLFNDDHISYWIDVLRDGKQETMPSLTDLVEKAIDILDTDVNGYFLLVEGGRIDNSHHGNSARLAISEAAEFSRAIQAAVDRVNLDETLIAVTADHGHVMTIAGYAERGNDIFGIAGEGDDGLPYFTISYANGWSFPRHFVDGKRVNPLTLEGRDENDFLFPVTVHKKDETHGGEDVGIWAVGPWAHLFRGTLEQNMIPHIMAYASCVGDGLKACDEE